MKSSDVKQSRSGWRWLCCVLILIALLVLSYCSTDAGKKQFCDGYCGAGSDKQIYVLMNKSNQGGQLLDMPYSKLLFKTEDGDLMAPSDGKWARAGDSRDYVKKKTRGLQAGCFSTEDYTPASLSTLTLAKEDVTITVLNMSAEGRLESYDLATNPFDVSGQIPAQSGNYRNIQNYLLALPRTAFKPTSSTTAVRPLSGTPDEKTPFHKGFATTEGSPVNGHVMMYLLADDNLEFDRGPAAMYAHTPAAQSVIGTLYSPFFQYEVRPFAPHNTRPDVLTIHFKRGGTMLDGLSKNTAGEYECDYPYDLAVIAKGQSGELQDTPLLIDPEIGPKGGFP